MGKKHASQYANFGSLLKLLIVIISILLAIGILWDMLRK